MSTMQANMQETAIAVAQVRESPPYLFIPLTSLIQWNLNMIQVSLPLIESPDNSRHRRLWRISPQRMKSPPSSKRGLRPPTLPRNYPWNVMCNNLRMHNLCRWHCLVGRNFASYVTHEDSKFIYFYIGQMGVCLFATA